MKLGFNPFSLRKRVKHWCDVASKQTIQIEQAKIESKNQKLEIEQLKDRLKCLEAEYESLLADKKRLDFIEKNWCEVIDGIPEIKITTHIIVGETQLRPALDQVINGYEKLNFHWEYSNWISVDDKLPEVETPVIAFCEGEYGEHYAIASREIADGEYFWVAINQNGPIYDLAINVTHWQPIPRPLIKE